VQKAVPRYPRLARELGKEGSVLLRLTIDERGSLTHVEVLRGAGSGFDEEAVRAARESRFSPARMNGRAVACRAQLPVRFVLRSNEND
jgi:protein TonB